LRRTALKTTADVTTVDGGNIAAVEAIVEDARALKANAWNKVPCQEGTRWAPLNGVGGGHVWKCWKRRGLAAKASKRAAGLARTSFSQGTGFGLGGRAKDQAAVVGGHRTELGRARLGWGSDYCHLLRTAVRFATVRWTTPTY
jgi:hypothetical protein